MEHTISNVYVSIPSKNMIASVKSALNQIVSNVMDSQVPGRVPVGLSLSNTKLSLKLLTKGRKVEKI